MVEKNFMQVSLKVQKLIEKAHLTVLGTKYRVIDISCEGSKKFGSGGFLFNKNALAWSAFQSYLVWLGHNRMISVGKLGALDSTRYFQCQQMPAVVQFSDDNPGDCSAFAIIIESILCYSKGWIDDLCQGNASLLTMINRHFVWIVEFMMIFLINCTLIA